MGQQPLFDMEEHRLGAVEEVLRERGIQRIVGVDEAGRGPLAGPVHAAAYWLEVGELESGEIGELLDDSKKMKEIDRESIFEILKQSPKRWAIETSSAERIDEINILEATFEAMHRAVQRVVEGIGEEPELVMIDGHMVVPGLAFEQRAVVKGDGRSRAIAAASVLAKVSRDRWMKEMAGRWPEYGFESHKGYGTAQHREALKSHGPCPIHRQSFGGVPDR